MPMISVLFLIGTVQLNKFRCSYLRNNKLLLKVFFRFLNFISKFQHFEKKYDPHSPFINEITNSERRRQTNFYKVLFQKTLRQATWETVPKTVEICTRAFVSYFLINSKETDLEKFLLVICKILEHFFNTFNADDKKQKSFSDLFSQFSNSRLNFEHFQKKDELHSLCADETTDSERRGQTNI